MELNSFANFVILQFSLISEILLFYLSNESQKNSGKFGSNFEGD